LSLALEDIIITIDTREQNKNRISAVERWGELHGAIIEHCKLDHLDYRLVGDFKGHEINIGIEAKALSQFCSDDYQENKDKLFAACSIYDEVALFIETGNYEFIVSGFGDTNISCRVKQDLTITGKLALFEGACSTLGRYGIHVRQLRSEAHFPYAIENLLTYYIHDHQLIQPKSFTLQYKQALLEFCTPLQTKKLMQHYPNMFWLCSASEESYKEILGSKTGKKLYDFIRNPELVTDAWSKSHFPDGTEIEEHIYEDKDVIKAVTEYLQGFPEGRTADEICIHFNIMPGDDDKEKFLKCLKKMAYKNIITNTVTGLFHIPITKLQSSSTDKKNKDYTQNTTNLTKFNADDALNSSINTHDTLSSQCDPAGALLPPIPIILSPADANHSNNIAPKRETAKDNSMPSSVSCGEIPQGASSNDKAGRKGTPQGNRADNGLMNCKKYEPGDVCVTLHSNDKTDKSGIDSPCTSQEPKTKGKAPVLSESEELFGHNNPDWKPVDAEELKIRNQDNEDFEILTADHKMSIRKQLEVYLEKPRTQQECVDKLSNFSKGAVSDHIFYMKQEGVIVEFDNKTLVMTR